MGKRGPKKGAGTTPIFGFRLPLDLRECLEKRASESESTLSREIVERLRRSLREDAVIEKQFGSKEVYRIASIISMIIDRAQAKYPGKNWLFDQEVFDFTLNAVKMSLEGFRPGGPGYDYNQKGLASHLQAKGVARSIWRDIAEAQNGDPLHPLRNIATDLSEIADRPNPWRGEFEWRSLERAGTLMKQAGLPIDTRNVRQEDRDSYLSQRIVLLEQARNDVETEMISEGKDPRLSEEDTFF